MDFIYALDLLGTFVFAISGTLAAGERNLDIFGAGVIAFATAVGGGTIRDVLIGSLPVGWMLDLNYLAMIGLGVLASVVFKSQIIKWNKTMFLFDAIGIGLFTILGLQKTLLIGLSPVIAIMMGTVSAVFGGVVRDVLTNRIPLIFRKEIYATACILGAVFFILLDTLGSNQTVSIIVTVIFIISIRILVVTKNWSLPTLG